MPTNYPAQLDTLSNPAPSSDTAADPHSSQHANANDAIEAVQTELGTTPSGSSATVRERLETIEATAAAGTGGAFPAQPAYGNNRPFYRTDRRIWYFYDGTRWLSCDLYEAEVPPYTLPQPFSATQSSSHRGATPHPGVYEVWLETFLASFFVGAGTALGASHKWVVVFNTHPNVPTTATINIDSGASSTYRVLSAAMNAVSPITELETRVGATKTGTPGDLNLWPRYTYRLIG